MKRILMTGLVAAMAFAVTTGCSRRSKSPDLARVDEEAIAAAQAPVNILDADLRNRVAADLADSVRLPDGRLQARVNLRNSTKEELYVLARTVFKDSNGLSTGDATEWEQIFFAPQQIVTYDARSEEPDAVFYTVEVRRP